MNIELDLQIVTNITALPKESDFLKWINAALVGLRETAELCVRIVNIDEMITLNQNYRNKTGPTNVLSFPSTLPTEIEPNYLGDIILCAPVVLEEASKEHKPLLEHFAHLTLHGVLHLLGYDHIQEADALIMEALEIKILSELGISNPYREETIT